MAKIKGCPFCGSKAEIRHNRNNPTFETWVECINRSCQARTASDDSAQGAVTTWNKRVAEDPPSTATSEAE